MNKGSGKEAWRRKRSRLESYTTPVEHAGDGGEALVVGGSRSDETRWRRSPRRRPTHSGS